jgi:two-component system nitrogen regulation sensor histidine kinase NtrY
VTELSLKQPEPPAAAEASAGKPREPRRRKFTDNPRLIGAVVMILAAVLLTLFFVATRTDQLRPEYISEALLFSLSSVCLTLIVALVFVLARTLLKLWVEQKRALPSARFRTKLVVALLLMTIMPALLVLVIGSEIIFSSATLWFSTPAEELVQTARDMAQRVYADRAVIVVARAERLAQTLPPDALAAGDLTVLQPRLVADVAITSSGLVEIYRASAAGPGAPTTASFLTSVGDSTMSQNRALASADRLAARVALSGRPEQSQDQVSNPDGLLIRAAAPVRANGTVVGVVVASEALTGKLNDEARRMADAFNQYRQLKVLENPLKGTLLAFFLMVTLFILISATWFGLFIAKRITRPVQMLAEGARAVGAGQLDLRIEPDSTDELGSLVESFNTMAAELRTSHERLDARRRYIETILERVATGVVSLSADGRVLTVNRAASSLLGLDESALGKPATEVFARHDLAALQPILDTTTLGKSGSRVEEITIASDEREVHLAVTATMLGAEGRAPEGAVVVFDDVTPLIRAERVAAWRDVARRLAHEIKNPLTPIQLSAERLQRNFSTAPPNARALVDECTAAIITEVEALKGLVDDFAQFARMRGPKLAAADLNFLASDTLRLYAGVLQQGAITVTQQLAPGIPRVRMDVEQMRQVIINLVDNAIDALGGASVGVGADGVRPQVAVATSFDPAAGTVRLTIGDNGPGVPAADRDKLFLPYYSTKGRGSGLGLAIVGRIITEHGGTVTVGDAEPRGAQFMIDLPAA